MADGPRSPLPAATERAREAAEALATWRQDERHEYRNLDYGAKIACWVADERDALASALEDANARPDVGKSAQDATPAERAREKAEAWVRDYDDVTVEREAGQIILAQLERANEAVKRAEDAERERDDARVAFKHAKAEAQEAQAARDEARAVIQRLHDALDQIEAEPEDPLRVQKIAREALLEGRP